MVITRANEIYIQRLAEEFEKLRIARATFNQEADLREQFLIQNLCERVGGNLSALDNFEPHTEDNTTVSTEVPAAITPTIRRLLARVSTGTPPRVERTTVNPNPPETGLYWSSVSSKEESEDNSASRERPLVIGSRVRILNRITHATGTETEADRLATVIKVNRVRIKVKTDSGKVTNRIRSNLQVISSHEQLSV